MLLDVDLDDGPGSGVDGTVATMDGVTNVNGQNITDGEMLDIFLPGPGQLTLHVEAKDNLGNPATKDITFTAFVTIESLRDNMNHAADDLGMITKAGVRNALLSHLEAAIDARDRGSCGAMHNQIDALELATSTVRQAHIDARVKPPRRLGHGRPQPSLLRPPYPGVGDG